MKNIKIGQALFFVVLGFAIIAMIFNSTGYEVPPILWYLIAGTALANLIYAVVVNGMIKYLARRLLDTVFVLWIIATLVFVMLRILPGGPFDTEKRLPPEIEANINKKYGLNEPLHVQYTTYITNLLRGDLGESYKYIGRSVTDIIADSMPVSFQLGFYALLVSFLIGIPAGVLAASKHNTWADSGLMFMSIAGVAVPTFVLAPVLILIFADKLGWFPPALWEGPAFYVLPVLTLGIRPIGVIARLVRSSVLEVIRTDFVRTAMAKGLKYRVVLFKHVLRNSLIPVLTVSGPLVAGILSGSFVIEYIYAVPGMGKHFITSVTNRDYPLVLGMALLYGTLLIIANLVVDILYAVVDPRIKVS